MDETKKSENWDEPFVSEARAKIISPNCLQLGRLKKPVSVDPCDTEESMSKKLDEATIFDSECYFIIAGDPVFVGDFTLDTRELCSTADYHRHGGILQVMKNDYGLVRVRVNNNTLERAIIGYHVYGEDGKLIKNVDKYGKIV